MRRVLVIGPPGAGKSTLAAGLSRRIGLPLIHLDQHYWRPGWVEPSEDAWAAQLDALAGEDRWIMDGNYGGSLAARLKRADTVILLDFAPSLCLWRVFKRTARQWRQVRADMAPACPERFNLEFLIFTATFARRPRRQILKKLERFDGTIIHLRRPSDVAHFLSDVAGRA